MFKELSEVFNNIKKIQSEMKDTLIEIKNNLQGNNSPVDEAKNQIDDLEQQQKKKTPNNNNNNKNNNQNNTRKKESKKMRIV